MMVGVEEGVGGGAGAAQAVVAATAAAAQTACGLVRFGPARPAPCGVGSVYVCRRACPATSAQGTGWWEAVCGPLVRPARFTVLGQPP